MFVLPVATGKPSFILRVKESKYSGHFLPQAHPRPSMENRIPTMNAPDLVHFLVKVNTLPEWTLRFENSIFIKPPFRLELHAVLAPNILQPTHGVCTIPNKPSFPNNSSIWHHIIFFA